MPVRSASGADAVPASAACSAAWSCSQNRRSAVASVATSAPEPCAAEAIWLRDRRISDTAMSTVPNEIAPSAARTTMNAMAPISAAA
jgi:hypothetical protein